MKLAENKVHTTKSIASDLFGSANTASVKKAERWLIEQSLNFSCLDQQSSSDEHGRGVKHQVINHLIDLHKRKRNSLLFARIVEVSSGETFLFANDARDGRRWISLGNAKNHIGRISAALQKLLAHENKYTVIIPSGDLTKISRDLVREWRSSETRIGEKTLRIALEVYSHGRGEITAYTDQTKRLGPGQQMTHLDRLEAEAIHIMREVAAEAENPVMLYSVGKDSSVMLHLARKAFYPSTPPFPLLHIDTRWKFQAMYDFRDYMAKTSGMELIVHINPEGVAKNINPLEHGSILHTDIMKTQSLKQALDHHKFDIALGGARRDEEKSRAKERICSFRTRTHQWDPKNQRPELWHLYNLRKNPGESIRVFPLSNWTELDIWQYIYREQIPIVPLYFAAERPVVERDGALIMLDDDRLTLHPDEKVQIRKVRFRTLGCYPLTGAIVSDADSLELTLLELLKSRTSERQGRAIDSDASASMEKKKQEGYF